jgi:DNA-binding CsgD family transcriptional regulator
MNNWTNRIPYLSAAFVVFTLYVFVDSAVEIVSEFNTGESMIEMVDDLIVLAISVCIVILFGIEYLSQCRDLRQLQGQLDNARGQLAQMDSSSQQLASQYRAIMQHQFDVWSLTLSEQDVVLALLKGLSFREVAKLRNTKEKTVRQQATNVYKKAGVAGRHELAAWFFEDMLEPPRSIS